MRRYTVDSEGHGRWESNAWTDSGKPIPYPSGKVSPCVLCGVPADDTWDGLALCGECEGEMVAGLRGQDSPSSPARSCVDCGEAFTPLVESARRCSPCNAVKHFG